MARGMGRLSLGAVMAIAGLASGAAAAQEPAPSMKEKIEVTGSNIKRLDSETALPMTTITRT